MKIKLNLLAIVFVFSWYTITAQDLAISNSWKFETGDDAKWSTPNFNDQSWKSVNTHSSWEAQGFPGYDGYAWYRKKIVISSSFKKVIENTGALRLCLGLIDDEDETYFNGKLIGRTQNFSAERNYLLSDEDIVWDKENTIAIRVKDTGGDGGMWSGKTFISTPKLQSIVEVKVETNIKESDNLPENGNVKGKVLLLNKGTLPVDGELQIAIYDQTSQKVRNESHHITLLKNTVTYDFSEIMKSSLIKIETRFTSAHYTDTIWATDVKGYADVKYTAKSPIVSHKVKQLFQSLPLEDVALSGFLKERTEINANKRLLRADIKRMLAGYLNRPGEQDWIGEHIGKFLDAACRSYRSDPNPELKKLIDRSAQQLIACQLPGGYLGTYTNDYHWTSWDVWCHKYNLVGLLSYYSLSGYEPALDAAKKIGNLLTKTFGTGTGHLDITLAGLHIGMAATSVLDPMTDLYAFTADKQYLDFCRYIISSYDSKNGPKIISTLNTIGRVDKTANGKAYEMLSNLLGIIKLYSLTNDEALLHPVIAGWSDITKNRMYITGTTSSFEHFQDNQKLPASESDHMGEGCVTTTWIQLNHQLYVLTGQMQYLDEIERAVYNHLLAAENPQDGCVSYYTPLLGVKPFSCDITCCLSSIPRGISMIPMFTYGMLENTPMIAFYESGKFKTSIEVDKKSIPVEFVIKSEFPKNGNSTIQLNMTKSADFNVLLRVPYWSEHFVASVNGIKTNSKLANGILSINRKWKNGDVISIMFDIPIKQIDGGLSYPNYFALQRGPQVLAVDESINDTHSLESISLIDQKSFSNSLQLDKISPNWNGKQFYKVNIHNDLAKTITLVPYSEASQSGGICRVWLPKK